jgi:hypothetical protein
MGPTDHKKKTYGTTQVSFKLNLIARISILVFSLWATPAFAAKCQVGGAWYDYKEPICQQGTSGARTSEPPIQVTNSSPIEAKLAALDTRSNTVQSSIVRSYAELLDHLGHKCKENRQQIADFSAKGVELLGKKRVTMSHFGFLQSMKASVPDNMPPGVLSCAEVAAALVTLTN